MDSRTLTPAERAHLWLLATSMTGHPVAPIVGDVWASPVCPGERFASTQRRASTFTPGAVVEVLLDSGVVILAHVGPSHGRDLVYVHGLGAYARGRVRRADHGSRWSARGWWVPVTDADARDGLIYDWAHLATAKVGQCWGDGEWAQAPPEGAMIFRWRTEGRPADFYEVT